MSSSVPSIRRVYVRLKPKIAIIGFIAASQHAKEIGGDALNGYIEGSQYFVGSHGQYTEVSKELYEESHALHSRMLITHPTLIALGLFFVLLSRLSRKETDGS